MKIIVYRKTLKIYIGAMMTEHREEPMEET